MRESILLIALFSILVLSIAAGFRTPKVMRSRLREFFLGDGSLNAAQGAQLLLSTSFSLNGILYQTWLGYNFGLVAALIQLIWCSSYFLLRWRLRHFNPISGPKTLHGAIGTAFSGSALRCAAIASVLGFTAQVGWEVVVGATVIGAKIDLWVVGLFIALAAAIYTASGGLRGNLRANEIQNAIACFGLVAFIGLIFGRAGSSPELAAPFAPLVATLGWGALLANVVFSLAWQFVDMSAWQTLASTKSDVETRAGTLSQAAFWVLLFPGAAGTLLGVALRHHSGDFTDQGILVSALDIVGSNPWILLFIGAGLFAALLSTIDGLLLAAAQALSWDLIDRSKVSVELDLKRETPSPQERQLLLRAKNYILILAAIGGGLFTFLVQREVVGVFDLVYLITVAQMSLVPTVMALFFDRRGKFPAAESIVFGLVGGFSWWLAATLLLQQVRILGSSAADLAPIVTVVAACLPLVQLLRNRSIEAGAAK